MFPAPRWIGGAVLALALMSASAPETTPAASPARLAAALPASGASAGTTPAFLPPPARTAGAAGPAYTGQRQGGHPHRPPAAAPVCPRSNGARVLTAPGRGRTVALTFDDGPSAATPGVLAALAAEHVHATFFEVGTEVAADPAMTRRVDRAGHLLGDHSWSHRYPAQIAGGWSRTFLLGDLRRTDDALTALTGRPVCWFRPPGGFYPAAVPQVAARLRLHVALWSVDTRDWADQTTSRIVRAALAGVGQEHPVVLMHDGGGPREATVAAVRAVIRGYRAHGYRFVRLDGRS